MGTGDHVAERRKSAVVQGKEQNAQTTARVAAVAADAARAASAHTRADRSKRGPQSDIGSVNSYTSNGSQSDIGSVNSYTSNVNSYTTSNGPQSDIGAVTQSSGIGLVNGDTDAEAPDDNDSELWESFVLQVVS